MIALEMTPSKDITFGSLTMRLGSLLQESATNSIITSQEKTQFTSPETEEVSVRSRFIRVKDFMPLLKKGPGPTFTFITTLNIDSTEYLEKELNAHIAILLSALTAIPLLQLVLTRITRFVFGTGDKKRSCSKQR